MTPAPHQATALAARAAAPAPWLAIAGAKGGVGKTMLATNLALLLARAGYRPLLVDFDPGCGNVGVHLRLGATRDLEDVAAGRCAPHEALLDGPGRIRVLLGRSGSTALTEVLPPQLDALLRAVSAAAAGCDVVVVDTGAGIGPMTLAAAARADLTLCVTTPDVSAVTDTYALCKVLHQRARPLPQLVVNRTRSRDEAMRTAARLATVTRKFLATETRLCGFVGEHADVERSIREQRPLALAGDGPCLDDLQSVCAAALAGLPALSRQPTSKGAPKPAVRLRPLAG